MRRPAKALRFCTMAARWNSSRAPESPRSRRRSKRDASSDVQSAFPPVCAGRAISGTPCLHFAPRYIAGMFVDITRDPPRRHVGTARRLERADTAVRHGCEVTDCMALISPPAPHHRTVLRRCFQSAIGIMVRGLAQRLDDGAAIGQRPQREHVWLVDAPGVESRTGSAPVARSKRS